MKQLLVPVCIFVSLAFAVCAWGQSTKTVKKVPPAPTAAIDGPSLYRQYCAACHGTEGKGDGPAADALKVRPTDLTQISRQNKGRFPEDRFMKIIDGEQPLSAHGSSDMPVWGPVFRNMTTNQMLAQQRIHALLNFIEEMQAK